MSEAIGLALPGSAGTPAVYETRDKFAVSSGEAVMKLLEKNIRADIDENSERMNMKIRKAQLEKIPLMIIIGDKELNDKKLSVRLRTGENYQDLDSTYLINAIQKSESNKSELTI